MLNVSPFPLSAFRFQVSGFRFQVSGLPLCVNPHFVCFVYFVVNARLSAFAFEKTGDNPQKSASPPRHFHGNHAQLPAVLTFIRVYPCLSVVEKQFKINEKKD
jgi:hypothetical protein